MPENDSSSNAAQPLTFEEAFARLEQTVQALEQGGLSLDDATRMYEEGMRLAQLCNQMLSATELKVAQLRNAFAAGAPAPLQPPHEEEPPQ